MYKINILFAEVNDKYAIGGWWFNLQALILKWSVYSGALSLHTFSPLNFKMQSVNVFSDEITHLVIISFHYRNTNLFCSSCVLRDLRAVSHELWVFHIAGVNANIIVPPPPLLYFSLTCLWCVRVWLVANIMMSRWQCEIRSSSLKAEDLAVTVAVALFGVGALKAILSGL